MMQLRHHGPWKSFGDFKAEEISRRRRAQHSQVSVPALSTRSRGSSKLEVQNRATQAIGSKIACRNKGH